MQLAALLVSLIAIQAGGKLQIKNVVVGKGLTAQAADYVTVDYTGKLTSGKVFDTSKSHGPFSFILGAGQVIKGWDRGVAGMKVGGKRVLTIPPELGYGARGAGADIPPNSTLIFDVELRKIDRLKSAVLKKGSGPLVVPGDTVSVHYKGTLAGGKQFDSSYDRGQPMEVQIGRPGLIPGFTMGLLGMQAGEKKRITIPPQLAYGPRGFGGVIPPNATLTFELEVVKVAK